MENKVMTPNLNIKTFEIKEGENNYKCQIQIIKNFLQVSIYLDNKLKYEGNISLQKIQNQIILFSYYNINEIYEEINLLNDDNFKIVKGDNKYEFKIKFIILRRKYELNIELEDDIILDKNDLIKEISELKEIINNKDNKIKLLEEELKKYKTVKEDSENNNNNFYNNFNIKLKEPIHKLQYHTSWILCSIILKDGRFATGSLDKSIIIYNNKTFKSELTIKEHNGYIYCLTQLSSGILASCSGDKTIKLYNIKKNEYQVIQTLNYHTNYVYKIIELNNKKLVSCSEDNSIIFYFKDNNEYIKDYQIKTNGKCSPVIQTKDNEIFYSEGENNAICFFDLLERKLITRINNINKRNGSYDWFTMISKDLLMITGENKISIINVNLHSLVRTIDVPDSSWINVTCLLNENQLLTVDNNKKIIQWKIEGDNLILISKKENAHEASIGALLKLGDGHILTGDDSGIVKIW